MQFIKSRHGDERVVVGVCCPSCGDGRPRLSYKTGEKYSQRYYLRCRDIECDLLFTVTLDWRLKGDEQSIQLTF